MNEWLEVIPVEERFDCNRNVGESKRRREEVTMKSVAKAIATTSCNTRGWLIDFDGRLRSALIYCNKDGVGTPLDNERATAWSLDL